MMINGDCKDKLKDIPDNSIDSVVTDPPYELGFMGKKWDSTGIANDVDMWKEVLRVLKPGGHLIAFSGTRTYHRMASAIENAGFEIRDMMQWLYGSGFPKSMNISKQLNKMAGVEFKSKPASGVGFMKPNSKDWNVTKNQLIQSGESTPEAIKWSGWDTALKPANEPMVLARKPLSEKTVADNVMRWGTGGINIDDSRIPSTEMPKSCQGSGWASVMKTGLEQGYRSKNCYENQSGFGYTPNQQGRFPANVLLDETAAAILDEQSETTKSGGASRFFYCSKASKRERGEGNDHATVKPLKLMEYLVTLVTPPNGTVLDPFAGSGTTGIAAKNKGFNFVGIEQDSHYCDIAEMRIKGCL